MSRFRKTPVRAVPSLNTTALPDLIFTLLFFFMLVTNMRTVPVLTQYQLPSAAELQQLKDKSLLVWIMVGNKEEMQLNSDLCTFDELPALLDGIKSEINPDEFSKITAVLKIDKNTPMGTVNDIRQILRAKNILTVYYAAEKLF
ncbi:MAG: biopolymer transporter ExbD [Dysgonamonadaceae bacterium]|jgi:biopolymer transport protein ExbD|nr:biopolymer transporter ExbD [Dysgonamonadaceae bacterium]